MIKILTVIGARPQFIKAAAISRAIRLHFSSQLEEVIVHTGQHYDHNMSEVFFNELEIPAPWRNLEISGMDNATQIERMTVALDEVINEVNPHVVLVYGDTNSTHAAALAASQNEIPLVHVEAGLRSFNLEMPEEINRIVADKNSTLLFVPTEQGLDNLKEEGYVLDYPKPYSVNNPGVLHCGDVMYDNALFFQVKAENDSSILDTLNIENRPFVLATVHRNTNTDHSERLADIFMALVEIAESDNVKVVLPLHPRTRKMMTALPIEVQKAIANSSNLLITDPVSYLDMIQLESRAAIILTDSGGVQKEAFFFKKPCVILRSETEWIELVENGNAVIADADKAGIVTAYHRLSKRKDFTWPNYYGDGRAAEFICRTIVDSFSQC
jgi:UDP-GlcNAc3NAcA epimerase